jgi:hypothetical protein
MTQRTLILFVIFALAIGLRLTLAIVNRDANDPHWEVSEIILRENRLPDKSECFECFQPKLYHGFVAQTWKALRPSGHHNKIKIAQLINAVAGLITVLIAWIFLQRIPVGETARMTAFALVALNPCLIAINGQATNDSFAILFGSAAIYCLYLFFTTRNTQYFWGLTVCVIFTALSKGTGLVLFMAIALIFLVRIVLTKDWSLSHKGLLPLLLTYLLLFFAVVPFAGEYYARSQKYGSPFVTNKTTEPRPHLFKETSVSRPGSMSVVSAFLPFRLIDMLRMPYITNDFPVVPLHRTSLWSQLYGRTHFVFFDQWPYSWQTTKPSLMNLGRIILLLALVPTLILLRQFVKNVVGYLKCLSRRQWTFFTGGQSWMLDLILGVYLSFIIYLNYIYRDFSWMKSIYIFPCLLCAAYILAHGMETAFQKWPRSKKPVVAVCCVLVALYVLTVGALIYKLSALS